MANLGPLLALIRKFEGLRKKPYICPAGVPTIGYGSTRYEDGKPVSLKDRPISEARAEELMQRDAAAFAAAAVALSPNLGKDDARLAAIADFCYNLGTTRYKSSTLRRKVEAEDWDGATEQLMRWVFGGGKKLPGLVKRRLAESILINADGPKGRG